MWSWKRGLLGCSLFLGLVLFAVPMNSRGEISFDEMYRLLLIGRWGQVSDVYAVSEFSASMLYQANIYRSEQQKEELARLEGVWQVENGHLVIRLTKVSSARFRVGSVVVEKIQQIDGRKLVLIDADGERYTKLRLRETGV